MSQKPLSSWDASLDRQEQEREENYFQQWRMTIRKAKEKTRKKISGKSSSKKALTDKEQIIMRDLTKEGIFSLLANPLTFFLGVFLFDLYALASFFSPKIKLSTLDFCILGFVNILALAIIMVVISLFAIIKIFLEHPIQTTYHAITS